MIDLLSIPFMFGLVYMSKYTAEVTSYSELLRHKVTKTHFYDFSSRLSTTLACAFLFFPFWNLLASQIPEISENAPQRC